MTTAQTASSQHKFVRESKRYEVHLRVRLHDARSFADQHVSNLSEGGLFVAGATTLKPLDQVHLDLDLPGFASYGLDCRVAHVVSPEVAAARGLEAGAGLAIMTPPEGFAEVLQDYLAVLEHRGDALVLLRASQRSEQLLAKAGYRVATAPAAEHVLEVVQASERVLAIVVRSSVEAEYRAALAPVGLSDLVIGAESGHSMAGLLNTLDRRIDR